MAGAQPAGMTNDTLLITLGCSWTFGVGVNWRSDMSREEYMREAWNTELVDQHSWRGLIANQYGWKNHNLSCGGSSNQKQFRLAKEYFSSLGWKRDRATYKNIKVLWGLTSTARNELWSTEQGELVNFAYHASTVPKLSRFALMNIYDHENEVRNLALEIVFWNEFFERWDIDNYWFDTFNHHDYQCAWPGLKEDYEPWAGPDWPTWQQYLAHDFAQVPESVQQELVDLDRWRFARQHAQIHRLIGRDKKPRDILSSLAHKFGVENDAEYHTSSWDDDSSRISCLVKEQILNPISFHPTKQGHRLIAQWFYDQLPNWFAERSGVTG